ncbi:DNA-binding protein [Lactiplantibacillus fabifermentans T30PCM01]|uniref:DNA-binding protein n=1 Tax=Lactiplantibacillus fabifermentans T30PCM01 TaxID=1400520 RepID=W6TAS9_9LACO|nr:HIRAN domain-containing protein [Lactiplantibacillus fabifermentans]ETY75677.1 DNA-binding protein [Lactiplantibacillus fabifermentans T30PCM01]
MQLQVGMQVTTQDQQSYRILALVNHGQQVLVQGDEHAATVQVIDVSKIIQIAEQKSADDLALATVTVVGERYVEHIATTLSQLQVGAPVLLQREGHNQYDDQAISVWTLQHEKLGYIARYQNSTYAQLMDQQASLYGCVETLDVDNQKLTIMLKQVTTKPCVVPAMRVQQRDVTGRPAKLGVVPSHALNTPLGDLRLDCDGQPLKYQWTALSPWITPDDELFVTQRYWVVPNWSAVTANSTVTAQVGEAAEVINRWQDAHEQGLIVTNATSFYVVGLSVKTMTGLDDNFPSDATVPQVNYHVTQPEAYYQRGFMVSWVSYGEPQVQTALRLALQYPTVNLVEPYVAHAATATHATFTREELATVLVSALPNFQGNQMLAPSVSSLTVEKLRTTLGDTAYHALASYQRRVQLLPGSTEGVDETLLQALIHATLYHEIATLHYHLQTVGMLSQPIYPVQLFSTTPNDDQESLVACLAFYNFETFEIQQVTLRDIASIAIIADPEHPQMAQAPTNPDWLQIFLHSWNE